jgi:hypothetical protein
MIAGCHTTWVAYADAHRSSRQWFEHDSIYVPACGRHCTFALLIRVERGIRQGYGHLGTEIHSTSGSWPRPLRAGRAAAATELFLREYTCAQWRSFGGSKRAVQTPGCRVDESAAWRSRWVTAVITGR